MESEELIAGYMGISVRVMDANNVDRLLMDENEKSLRIEVEYLFQLASIFGCEKE